MSVHPDLPALPVPHVKERVLRLELHKIAVGRSARRRAVAGLEVAQTGQSVRGILIEIDAGHRPSRKRPAAERDPSDETLHRLVHDAAEVVASHRLDENLQLAVRVRRLETHLHRLMASVEEAHVRAVDAHHAEISDVCREVAALPGRNRRAVDGITVAEVRLLERLRILRPRDVIGDGPQGGRLRRGRHGHRLERILRRRLGNRLAFVQIAAEEILHRRKLGRMRPARLGHRRIVVIARGLRTERRVAARPPAERRAAVRHVDGERGLVLQHVLEVDQTLLRTLHVVALAPAVEPGWIVFAAHERTRRAHLAELLEGVLRIRPEVDDGRQLGDQSVREVVRGIAAEARNVETGSADRLVLLAHVVLVIAPEAVFILDLDHENIAAMRNLAVLQLLADGAQILAGRLEITLIARTEPNAVTLEEPPGQPAELPFRAGIGPRPEDDPQALLLRDAAERGHILFAGELVASANRFMVVPEHVGADGIEAAGLHHLDAVTPQSARDAREMHLTATNDELFAVQQEGLVPYDEGMLPRNRRTKSGRGQQAAHQDPYEFLHGAIIT